MGCKRCSSTGSSQHIKNQRDVIYFQVDSSALIEMPSTGQELHERAFTSDSCAIRLVTLRLIGQQGLHNM